MKALITLFILFNCSAFSQENPAKKDNTSLPTKESKEISQSKAESEIKSQSAKDSGNSSSGKSTTKTFDPSVDKLRGSKRVELDRIGASAKNNQAPVIQKK